MEEKSRVFTDFVAFFRNAKVQMDHWFGEEHSFYHSFAPEEETFPLAEFEEAGDWQRRKSLVQEEIQKAFFVDGRMRIHARILLEEKVLLLGEVVAGYAIWEKGRGIFMGFSPRQRPLFRRILGVPEEILRGTIIERQNLDLGGGFLFQLQKSSRVSRYPQAIEASHQALFNALSDLEQEVTMDLLEKGVPILKDGILRRGEKRFLFRPGVGPVGLVKRIERLPLSPEQKEILFSLSRGERTPFLSLDVQDDFLKVFSYFRLTERDNHFPWKGLIRMEVLLKKENFAALQGEVTNLFDRLATFLPILTADFPWRRLPENIFPIIALEDALGQFFASSSFIQYLYEKSLRR